MPKVLDSSILCHETKGSDVAGFSPPPNVCFITKQRQKHTKKNVF